MVYRGRKSKIPKWYTEAVKTDNTKEKDKQTNNNITQKIKDRAKHEGKLKVLRKGE